jgi:4-hydroxybenzoate polyprenyltransferase
VNQVLLGLPLDPMGPWLCFVSMYAVYTFAKTVRFDPVADGVNDPERTEFLKRWRGPLIALAAICFGVGWWQAPGLRFLLVWPVLTAVAYDVKFLPGSFRYRRLKDITGVKSLVVAITWSVLTVMLPLQLAGGPVTPAVVLLLLWNTLIWFINTVLFDVGDMTGDRMEGVVTVPLWLGRRNTLLFLGALDGLAVFLLWYGQSVGWLVPAATAVNLLGLYLLACIQAAGRLEDTGFLCDVVIDGMGVAAAILAVTGLLL